ncbi:hypothetical protein A2U01_0089744, partial [Trifolium medium]|nr:hypothetical protein [Trifolium medium]
MRGVGSGYGSEGTCRCDGVDGCCMAHEAVSRTADRVAQEARRGGEDELRLERFMNNKLPIFKGGYDPDGAQS